MATETKTRRTFTVSFPTKLADQVARMAQDESRTMSELFREAFRSYRAERVRAIFDESHAEGLAKNHNGHREEDIEGFVHELRNERRVSKQ